MASRSIRLTRLAKEVRELSSCCTPVNEDKLDILQAKIVGAEGTPYETGSFILRLEIPERYPFDPPRVRFLTKIYHPNIDKDNGAICLEILKTTRETPWKPTFNINTVLDAIKNLMAEPNPDDPLEPEIAKEFLLHKDNYLATARQWTSRYACEMADSDQYSQQVETLAPEEVMPETSAQATDTTENPSSVSDISTSANKSVEVRCSTTTESLSIGCTRTTMSSPTEAENSNRLLEESPIASQRSAATTPKSDVVADAKSQRSGKTQKVENKRNKPRLASGRAERKGQSAATPRQQKRPRYEDLFLDDDDLGRMKPEIELECEPDSATAQGDDLDNGEHHAASTNRLRDVCEMCSRVASKYSCPACYTRTCSLACIRSHKIYGCDGVAKKTRMVTLEQYDALTLLSDYRLLEEAGRTVAKGAEALHFERKHRRNFKQVRDLPAECAKRGIKLEMSPFGMEKSLSNTSCYNRLAETIFWRIEWVFADAGSYVVQTDRNPESVKLETLLRQFLKTRHGCDEIIPGFNEEAKFSPYSLAGGCDNIGWRCYIKVERNGWTRDTRYYQLDVGKSIRENLCGKIVIEFPTIYIAASKCDNETDTRFPVLTEDVRRSALEKKVWERVPKNRTFREQLQLVEGTRNGRADVNCENERMKNHATKRHSSDKVNVLKRTESKKNRAECTSGSENAAAGAESNSKGSIDHTSSSAQPGFRPLRRLLPMKRTHSNHSNHPNGRGAFSQSSNPSQTPRNPYAARRADKRNAIDELAEALSREREENDEIAVTEKTTVTSSTERHYPDIEMEKRKNDYFSLLGFHYGSSSPSDGSDLEEGEIRDN